MKISKTSYFSDAGWGAIEREPNSLIAVMCRFWKLLGVG